MCYLSNVVWEGHSLLSGHDYHHKFFWYQVIKQHFQRSDIHKLKGMEFIRDSHRRDQVHSSSLWMGPPVSTGDLDWAGTFPNVPWNCITHGQWYSHISGNTIIVIILQRALLLSMRDAVNIVTFLSYPHFHWQMAFYIIPKLVVSILLWENFSSIITRWVKLF